MLMPLCASAQFVGSGFMTDGGSDNMSQEANDTSSTGSSKPKFTIKRYFSALSHKDSMGVFHNFLGSVVLPGTGQIYNKDYWKLPVLYLGAGGLAGAGIYYDQKFAKTNNPQFKTNSTYFYFGAAVVYWASLLDGAISYKSSISHNPQQAALYSALLPGLGQIYNGDYWKLPIFYGGFIGCGFSWYYNGMEYKKFKTWYNKATTPNGGYEGNYTVENLKYYRDSFRRYRDYSILATVLVYGLQIIDANVFATMSDFDISDDITLNISPSVIEPISIPNYDNYALNNSSIGLKLNLNF